MSTLLQRCREIGEDLTRGIHAVIALPMPLLAVLFLTSWSDYAPSNTGVDLAMRIVVPLVVIFGLIWPSVRAWRRMVRGDGLLPVECLRERSWAAWLLVGCVAIALGIVLLIANAPPGFFHAELGVSVAVRWLSHAVLALLAAALLVGEWVLVGRE